MSGQVGAQSPTEPESGAGVSPNAVSETSQRTSERRESPNGRRRGSNVPSSAPGTCPVAPPPRGNTLPRIPSILAYF